MSEEKVRCGGGRKRERERDYIMARLIRFNACLVIRETLKSPGDL